MSGLCGANNAVRPLSITGANSLHGYYYRIVLNGSAENITFQTHGLSLEKLVSNTTPSEQNDLSIPLPTSACRTNCWQNK